MIKIWWYHQQVRVARFSSTQQQSCLRRHPTLISKVHLPFSNQPSHFLVHPAFSMSSSASLSSFDLQTKKLIPFSRHSHPPSSTHNHTNEHYQSQLIYGFIQTQHEHHICTSFSVFKLGSTHSSHHGSFCP